MGVKRATLEKWKGRGQSSKQSGTGTIPKPGLSDPASWLSPLVITEGLKKNREVLSIKSLSASTPRGTGRVLATPHTPGQVCFWEWPLPRGQPQPNSSECRGGLSL